MVRIGLEQAFERGSRLRQPAGGLFPHRGFEKLLQVQGRLAKVVRRRPLCHRLEARLEALE
jgi:hypothetical protein